MNPPEGRCGTPPAAGSPDRLDKATLKVHLPNGGFNVVKFGDAIDVKVRSVTKLWRTFVLYFRVRAVFAYFSYCSLITGYP